MASSRKTKPARGRRSLRELTRRYDQQNDEAAAIILAALEESAPFMIDWARRYQARRAQESRGGGSI
jgi:hypothetical protein